MWPWVSLLHTITAFVSSYLMDVLRKSYEKVQVIQQRLREFLENANDLIFSIMPDGFSSMPTGHVSVLWATALASSITLALTRSSMMRCVLNAYGRSRRRFAANRLSHWRFAF